MKNSLVLRFLTVFGVFFASFVTTAQAQVNTGISADDQFRARVSWVAGKEVVACTRSIIGDLCGPAKMPDLVGEIVNVYQGHFISYEVLSWLVISKNSASICGFGEKSKEVVCARIKVLGNIEDYDIKYNHGVFSFSSGEKGLSKGVNVLRAFGNHFVKSMMATGAELLNEMAEPRPTSGRGAMHHSAASVKSEPSAPPSTAAEDDGGGCEGSACGGDNGGDGGGEGDSGGGMQVIPITAPLLPAPAPPVPLPPISVCSILATCNSGGVSDPRDNPYLEAELKRCEADYEFNMEQCKHYLSISGNKREYIRCSGEAATAIEKCITRANETFG